MEPVETAFDELAADPDTRQRLGLTFTPDDVSPRVGEALVLQLASVPLPTVDVEHETRPLHVGIELNERFPAGYIFTDIRDVYETAVGVIACEAADRTAAMYTNADGPVTDPEIALSAYSAISHAGPSLQTAIARAMRTGEVPMGSTDGTHPAPGAITVTGAVDTGRRDTSQLAIDPTLAVCLDLVVAAEITDTLWLDGVSTEQPDPVEPALASVYLHHARQLVPTIDTTAREHLDTFYECVEITAGIGARETPLPSRVDAADTVERLAIATARLELADTVTPAHVETAVRLYVNVLDSRSLTVSAIEYWRAYVGRPRVAFENTKRMYTHIISEAFDRHGEPVSMAGIQDVAAEYNVEAATIAEFLESHEAVHETMPDDADDSEGPYFRQF